MTEESRRPVELLEEENRLLRRQLAAVQRDFEHYVMDNAGSGDGRSKVTGVEVDARSDVKSDYVTGGLVRRVRSRVGSASMMTELARNRGRSGGLAVLDGPEGRNLKEWARLRERSAIAEAQVAEIQTRLEHSRAAMANMQASRDRLQEEMNQSSQCAKDIEIRAGRFKEEMESLCGIVQSLETEITTVRRDLQLELRQTAELVEQIEAIHRACGRLESMVQSAEQREDTLRKRLAAVQDQIDSSEEKAENERTQFQRELNDAHEKETALRKRLQELERERQGERESRIIAEKGRRLDAENLFELRDRFAEIHDRLSEREKLIESLAQRLDSAWGSLQSLSSIDESKLSGSWASQLVRALREGGQPPKSDDA